ncbi:MAG: hypothetical protein ACLQGU_16550 [bacterium]
MDLTPTEIKYAEKCIRRLEKDTRQWPWMRWTMLVASIFILGISIYNFSKLADLNESISRAFSLHRSNFDPKEVELFVTDQLTNLRLEMVFIFRISLQTLVGGVWLVYCLMNWNRHLKSALMAKALRKLVSEE